MKQIILETAGAHNFTVMEWLCEHNCPALETTQFKGWSGCYPDVVAVQSFNPNEIFMAAENAGLINWKIRDTGHPECKTEYAHFKNGTAYRINGHYYIACKVTWTHLDTPECALHFILLELSKKLQ